MLPNRFALTAQSEERLKREKQRTGVPPNILARELFFRSIEVGPVIDINKELTMGKMHLEKTTWLGELESATESAIQAFYGRISREDAARVWALHIEREIS